MAEDIPDSVESKKPLLYQIYRERAKRRSLEEICRDLEFSVATFYNYQRDYPAWMSEINKRAVQDSIDDVREAEHVQVLARAQAQIKANEAAVAGIPILVAQIVEMATDEKTPLRMKMQAAKLLTEGVVGGWTIPPITPDEMTTVEALLKPGVVDLLALAGGTIKLGDGTEVQLDDAAQS